MTNEVISLTVEERLDKIEKILNSLIESIVQLDRRTTGSIVLGGNENILRTRSPKRRRITEALLLDVKE